MYAALILFWHYASVNILAQLLVLRGAADLDPESKREKHY